MSGSFLEIIELENGDIALKRMGEDGEHMVEIHFSDEVKGFLNEHKVDVAKAMIGAGVQAAGTASKSMVEAEKQELENRVLH